MESNLKIASYDVFDTLLTRRVCEPKTVFYFIGNAARMRGIITLTPDAFRKARVEAESLARIGVPDGEVAVEEIYQVLGRIIGSTDSQLQEIMTLELAWERRMILQIPGAKEAVEADRQAQREIHFISEMYLPAEFLEDLLREHGFMRDGDLLWVSNSHRASKRSGKLYSIVLKASSVCPAQVLHFGNDWLADVVAPQKLGLKVGYRPHANPSHYECLLERRSVETNGWTSLLAGTGRMVRLQPMEDARIMELRRVTANVVCPVLMGYVLWILQRAKNLGLQRLYFVSRDGYVPFLLAKHVAATVMPTLECRYFYGSRQAWHLAGLSEVDENALVWMLGHCDGLTCGSLLERMALSWEDCQECAPDVCKVMIRPENPVTENVRKVMGLALTTDSGLLRAIMAKTGEKRKLVRDYAVQEGLSNSVPTGMVEIGWSGRTRASFERALGIKDVEHLHWFYFGILNEAKLHDHQRVHYFLHGPELQRPEIPSLPVVIESFCLALHGSVTGYRREGGEVVPLFREGIEEQLDTWGRSEVFKAIQDFLNWLPVELGSFPDIGNMAEATRELAISFCLNPSAADARTWGSIPFEHDQAAKTALPVAPVARLSFANIKNALIFGDVQRACSGNAVGAWGAGAWAARRQPLVLLRLASLLGYLRVHWRQLPIQLLARIRRALSKFKHS
jgi:FMN phosphatase YigB (HAD superfamily)